MKKKLMCNIFSNNKGSFNNNTLINKNQQEKQQHKQNNQQERDSFNSYLKSKFDSKTKSPEKEVYRRDEEMGNTMNQATSTTKPSNTAQATNKMNSTTNSDFKYEKTSPPPPPPPLEQQPSTQQLNSANLIKLEQITNELTKLEEQVNEFQGKKSDKKFLFLEELLTRCLLMLDEVERSETDEQFNLKRKKMINFAHQLSDKLENKASSSSFNSNLYSTTNDININNNNDNRSSSDINNGQFQNNKDSLTNTQHQKQNLEKVEKDSNLNNLNDNS
jgi:hypothetical protein